MIGTIANTCAIIVGSVVGAVLKRGIRPQWQDVLFTAMGLASLALGFNAVCQNMPNSEYPILFILSLAIGGLVGTMLDLDRRFKAMVDRIGKKDKKESGSLAQGLATSTLLYCIGTLSIVGPINSALLGDNTYLFTNSTLDIVTSTIFAATYGFGIILGAPILFLWQGGIYMIARLCGDVISASLLCEMQIVGGVLIVASGLALLNVKDCKALNLLPSLFVPVVFFLLKSVF